MNSTPRYLLKRNKSIYLHKILYKNIHTIFMLNMQNLAATQMSISRRMSKPIMLCLYNGILLNNKNEHSTDMFNNTGKTSLSR